MIERKSFVRGEKRAEMQLINEIFVIYARLLRGFSDEAVAIEKLAHRIAANITDQTDLPMAKHHPCIEASLKAMIRLTIEAPALHIAALREEVDKLAHKLDIPIILELSLGNAAQLSFNVLGNNSSLAVNAERLLPILKNINNRFKLV
jgi:hypothetical protein